MNLCRFQSRLPAMISFTLQLCSLLAPMDSSVDRSSCSRTSVPSRRSKTSSRTSCSCHGPVELSSTMIWLRSTCRRSWDLRFSENACCLGIPTVVTSVKARRRSSKNSRLTLLWFREVAQSSFRFVQIISITQLTNLGCWRLLERSFQGQGPTVLWKLDASRREDLH